MIKVYFDSIDDYINYIMKSNVQNNKLLFRGQNREWTLRSKLLRLSIQNKSIKEIYIYERTILEEFKKTAVESFNVPSDINIWDILALSQHFGLPTRLIDWTEDPLIALWFAFFEEKSCNTDRVVFGLILEDDQLVNFEVDKPFENRSIKVFKPNLTYKRIASQKSWLSVQSFLVFGNGGDGLPVFNEIKSIEEYEEYNQNLATFIFPDNVRKKVLEGLYENGIHYASMFPDELSGLCRHIEWKHFFMK